MSVLAPLRVPVELRLAGHGRWFRLAQGVSEGGLLFPRALPSELADDAVIDCAFHLPEDAQPVACRARAIEVEPEGDEPDGAALLRAIRFLDLDPEPRARIARYVAERVPS